MEQHDILIVDDEAHVGQVLRAHLTGLKKGYRVELARSGEEALRHIAGQTFDLVISDLLMPGLDGLELLRRVRVVSPTTRLMLITAYGTPQVAERARLLDSCRYLTKPLVLDELTAAIAQMLQQPTSMEARSIVIHNEFDIIAARLQVRQLATARGFDLLDQARISLATSALAKNLALGESAPGRITPAWRTTGARPALQVVCIKVGTTVADLPPEVFTELCDLVDELKIKDLPSRDLQITMIKWLPRKKN